MMMHLLFSSFHRLIFFSYQHVCCPTLWSQPVPRLGQVSQFQNQKNNQRWNSWTAFLVEVSNESPQTRVFVWFSSHIFPFYKMLFMHRLKFSWFVDFFVCIFKSQSRVCFSLKSASWGYCDGAKDFILFFKFCQRILSQNFLRSFDLPHCTKKSFKN